MAPGIVVVGLGPGDPGVLTREAWERLQQAEEVCLRTGEHPVVRWLPQGPRVHTFDRLYESHPDFESVYQAIVEDLLTRAGRPEGVLYAVPGDPTVGEATVVRLREEAAARGLPFRILHGVSFVEPCLALAGLAALDGLHVVDGLDLARRHHPPFPPDAPALVGQLPSRLLASDVKLVLMNQYPEEHPVLLLHAAGTAEAVREERPLHELDHSPNIGSLTALLVPALPRPSAFESFQEIVAHLRAPEGCPWDREQTHESLRSHLLEEAYETLQAIDRGDMQALQEELGDLLLQVVLQAQIATEEGAFRMADVIAGIHDKIVRRHPHVFGDLDVREVDQVLRNWEALKQAEREEAGHPAGPLDGVPLSLPALAQAAEYQARAARVGFDWPDVSGVVAKVQEELQEVAEAETPERRAAEIGDLLFAVVNYARWLEVDPEAALRQANERFRRRFARVLQAARKGGRALSDMSLQEMDSLWEAAKEQR